MSGRQPRVLAAFIISTLQRYDLESLKTNMLKTVERRLNTCLIAVETPPKTTVLHTKTMGDIIVNIYGGNNQILPNATEANQYYGSNNHKDDDNHSSDKQPAMALTPEAQRLSLYIDNVETLRGYLTLLSQCSSAREVGEVVALMAQKEPALTPEEIVKERFIVLLPPLAPQLTKGTSTDNLRIHIDTAWRKRCRSIISPR